MGNLHSTRPHVFVMATAFAAAVTIAGVDIGTKWFVTAVVMDPPRRIPVLPFFDIVLVYNRGISFGMLGDLGKWGPLILSGLATGIIALLVVWLWRAQNRGEAFSLALVIGGALGNVVDRLHDGAVTDYLDLYAGPYHWPVFNIADIFITVGVLCLLTVSLQSQSGENSKGGARGGEARQGGRSSGDSQ